MNIVLGFIVAMSVTVALMPWLIRVGPRLGLIDAPNPRKVHQQPIPRVGGIAMVLGLLLALLLHGGYDRTWQALVLGNLVLFIMGIWDDRVELGSTPKFLAQALAALLAVVWGGVQCAHVTLQDGTLNLPSYLALPLTFFFLIGATNAVNLSDGLDGLAGGMMMLCLCALAVIAFTAGQELVLFCAVSLAGAVLGFLRFNSHPARVFMGDAGSQVLGFTTALLAIELTQRSAAPLSTALPLLLLGVPVTDTIVVMTTRICKGRSPFQADRNHLHHRLLGLGFLHVEAVVLSYMLQGLFFSAAWLLRFDSDLVIVGVYLLIAGSFTGLVTLAEHSGWRWRHSAAARTGDGKLMRLPFWLLRLTRRSRLPRWTLGLIVGTLVLYALSVLRYGSAPQRDAAWLAAAAAAVLLAGMLWQRSGGQISGWEKIALFVIAALGVSLDVVQGALSWLPQLQWLLFIVLGGSVVLWVRLSYAQRFEVTPLDLLVLIAAVTLPNLPESWQGTGGLGSTVLKLLVLFYAIETLSSASGRYFRWLNGGALAFVGVLLLRMV